MKLQDAENLAREMECYIARPSWCIVIRPDDTVSDDWYVCDVDGSPVLFGNNDRLSHPTNGEWNKAVTLAMADAKTQGSSKEFGAGMAEGVDSVLRHLRDLAAARVKGGE